MLSNVASILKDCLYLAGKLKGAESQPCMLLIVNVQTTQHSGEKIIFDRIFSAILISPLDIVYLKARLAWSLVNISLCV